ncbi:MAG: hypothetical protein PHF29_02130 [Candidatus Riflebacteria bacterium]|nr:hypothetical protein [Candidatus Riflebacteria bacterium]
MLKPVSLTTIILFLLLADVSFCQQGGFQPTIGKPTAPARIETERPAMPSVEKITEDSLPDDKSESEAKAKTFVYDPYLDNLLKAPQTGVKNGLFGYKISEVERYLKTHGARNHSYAFGKYSRMVLSKYLLIISFDKNKRVGAVKINPIPPNDKILSNAREFFMSVFLGDANASDFSISVSSSSLEIKYLGGLL